MQLEDTLPAHITETLRGWGGVILSSVRGPQLFRLFINDFNKVLNVLNMYLFADDNKSIINVDSYQDRIFIQQDLNGIEVRSKLT